MVYCWSEFLSKTTSKHSSCSCRCIPKLSLGRVLSVVRKLSIRNLSTCIHEIYTLWHRVSSSCFGLLCFVWSFCAVWERPQAFSEFHSVQKYLLKVCYSSHFTNCAYYVINIVSRSPWQWKVNKEICHAFSHKGRSLVIIVLPPPTQSCPVDRVFN